MSKKNPRTGSLYGMSRAPAMGGQDTWLEDECFAYGGDKYGRRCCARLATDREILMIVRCGIPDTMFSIPVRDGGWVEMENGVFIFHLKTARESS